MLAGRAAGGQWGERSDMGSRDAEADGDAGAEGRGQRRGGEDSAAACSPSVSHSAMIVARMPSGGRLGGAARVGHSEQQSKRGGRLLVCLHVHCAISGPAVSRYYLYGKASAN